MLESAQTSKDRQAVRQLGGQVRLLGMVFTGVAGYGALFSLPAEKPQILTSAALITFGLHITGKMARDCLMAANYARDPITSARQSLKSPGIVSKAVIFMAATMGLTTISDSMKENMQAVQAEIMEPAADPLAGVATTSEPKPHYDFVEMNDPNCPEGRTIIDFSSESKRTTITKCTGPRLP